MGAPQPASPAAAALLSPRTCDHLGCAKAFQPRRSDARYCSDACRAAASRARRRGGQARVASNRSLAMTSGPTELDRSAESRAELVAIRERLERLEARDQSPPSIGFGLQLTDKVAEHAQCLRDTNSNVDALRAQLDQRVGRIEHALTGIRDENRSSSFTQQNAHTALKALTERIERLEREDEALAEGIVLLRQRHGMLTRDLAVLASSMAELAEVALPGLKRP